AEVRRRKGARNGSLRRSRVVWSTTRSRLRPLAASPKRARRPKGVKASRHFSTSAGPPGGTSREATTAALKLRSFPRKRESRRNWVPQRGPRDASVAGCPRGDERALTQGGPDGSPASRRRHRERFGASQEPRPRALRQGNAVAHSRLQDAVAALARKVDALDAVSRRKRRNVARQAIRLAENALAIAEHDKVECDRNAVEKRRIELAACGQRRRDDRVADRETAKALDHEGKTGALWSAERQQRRERPGIGRVASLRVQSPAERNLAPGIARAHHLSHGDSRRGHVHQERRPVLGWEGNGQRIARDAGDLG